MLLQFREMQSAFRRHAQRNAFRCGERQQSRSFALQHPELRPQPKLQPGFLRLSAMIPHDFNERLGRCTAVGMRLRFGVHVSYTASDAHFRSPPAQGSSRLRSDFRCAAVRSLTQSATRCTAAVHNDAVIRVYDDAGNVVETHEHTGDFKEW